MASTVTIESCEIFFGSVSLLIFQCSKTSLSKDVICLNFIVHNNVIFFSQEFQAIKYHTDLSRHRSAAREGSAGLLNEILNQTYQFQNFRLTIISMFGFQHENMWMKKTSSFEKRNFFTRWKKAIMLKIVNCLHSC